MTEEEIRKENIRYFSGGHFSPPLPLVSLGVNSIEDLVGVGEVKALRQPEKASHKGQNGKLLIIGGSTLFHGASLWALKVASRIVDMVFYASVPENLQVLDQIKGEVLDFIAIPRSEIESYIEEAEVVLIGPGMLRTERSKIKDQRSKPSSKIKNLHELNQITDEGEQTRVLTDYLLHKYPKKQWVVDAGAIQVLDPLWIPEKAILTPHRQEFNTLLSKFSIFNFPASTAKRGEQFSNNDQNLNDQTEYVEKFAKKYHCVVLLKGERDIVSDGEMVKYTIGGNAGMTKGGTGDVLAGLVAAFACKNEPFLAAQA